MLDIDNKYVKEVTVQKTLYENISDNNFLYLVLYKDFAEIKFNIIELVVVENINTLCDEFIKGNYTIKLYMNNKSLLYSKLVWKKNGLKKYNQKTKYGFLRCKKINEIEIIKGIHW